MTVNAKPTGRAVTMPSGLILGGIASLAATLTGTAILAALVDREVLPPEKIGFGVMVMLILSAWLGAGLAAEKIKRRRLMVCALAGIVYYGILLSITALFFGGQYSGAGETALLILCGSMLPIFLHFHPGSGGKRRKIKRHTG